MRRRTAQRIDRQRARLRDGRSHATGSLGELTVTVQALRAAVAKLPAHRRDRVVHDVVRHLVEATHAALDEQHRTATHSTARTRGGHRDDT